MEITNKFANCSGIWRPARPASRDALARLRADCNLELPQAYEDLLSYSNGGEGELGVDPGWISIWPAEEVLARNSQYQVQLNVPGLFGFATNGGGELLALDTRPGPPYPIVMVPFIPMTTKEAKVVALDFDSLVAAIGSSLPAA